jgi:hypothetical protein
MNLILILHASHSVLGIISIPGMMTGAMLGGSSVQQAAKLQMIIMFMLCASTALASICCSAYATSVLVDEEHRVRPDRIYAKFSYADMSRIGNVVRMIQGLGVRAVRRATRVANVRRGWVELPTRRDEGVLT